MTLTSSGTVLGETWCRFWERHGAGSLFRLGVECIRSHCGSSTKGVPIVGFTGMGFVEPTRGRAYGERWGITRLSCSLAVRA
ncbi:hypothetical protein OIU76_012684 [Salix suchowensis]|uniref:Uncharacterized protein n=1 Tax=Salix purpurea TaxID=77065 RepID=A0A9Q0TH03_SALPP|nr:hypothetical protein OIU76_012684 [Salix suchowensis]KAJ6711490.1 hypothetical protein OIU79_007851 [Salix purpurea]